MTGAGLAPLPIQRPIPIWFGARLPSSAASGRGGSRTAGFRRCSLALT